MTKFFFKLKNTYLWSVFDQFPQFWGAKKVFPKNLACKTSYGSLVPCQNSEKPNDPILRKKTNRQQDGKMDRLYFIGPFWLLLGVQQVQLQ